MCLAACSSVGRGLSAGALVPPREELLAQHRALRTRARPPVRRSTRMATGRRTADAGRPPSPPCPAWPSLEGSTIKDGKYSERIRKATDWLMDRAAAPASLATRRILRNLALHAWPRLCHALSPRFTARKRTPTAAEAAKILTDGHLLRQRADQARRLGHVTAKDSNDHDEGSTTITQMALRGRNAGIGAEDRDRARRLFEEVRDARGIVMR